jgi:hypothetical protein
MKKKLQKSQSANSTARPDWIERVKAGEGGEFLADPPPPPTKVSSPANQWRPAKHLPIELLLKTLPVELLPKLDDPEALARLVGLSGKELTRENASKAVRFLFECSIVLVEVRAELERLEAFKAEANSQHGKRVRESTSALGIDIAKLALPMSRKEFIALLNREYLTIRGKRFKDDALWREFLRDILTQQLGHPANEAEMDESESNFERLGLDEMGFRIFASQWAYWSRKNRRRSSPFIPPKRGKAQDEKLKHMKGTGKVGKESGGKKVRRSE